MNEAIFVTCDDNVIFATFAKTAFDNTGVCQVDTDKVAFETIPNLQLAIFSISGNVKRIGREGSAKDWEMVTVEDTETSALGYVP